MDGLTPTELIDAFIQRWQASSAAERTNQALADRLSSFGGHLAHAPRHRRARPQGLSHRHAAGEGQAEPCAPAVPPDDGWLPFLIWLDPSGLDAKVHASLVALNLERRASPAGSAQTIRRRARS